MKPKIGTVSWSIPKEFKDRFPIVKSQLEAYSQVLNCVEINTTFYKSHKPETFKKVGRSPAAVSDQAEVL